MRKPILAVILTAAIALSAAAQSAKPYPVPGMDGSTSTNNVLALATNTYSGLIQVVDEFESAGLQVSLKASGATSGNALVRVAKSLDGATFETVPSLSVLVPLSGTSQVTAIANLAIPTASHLQISTIENTNAGIYLTNVSAVWRFKAPKVSSTH
jgi:hypothetical protein